MPMLYCWLHGDLTTPEMLASPSHYRLGGLMLLNVNEDGEFAVVDQPGEWHFVPWVHEHRDASSHYDFCQPAGGPSVPKRQKTKDGVFVQALLICEWDSGLPGAKDGTQRALQKNRGRPEEVPNTQKEPSCRRHATLSMDLPLETARVVPFAKPPRNACPVLPWELRNRFQRLESHEVKYGCPDLMKLVCEERDYPVTRMGQEVKEFQAVVFHMECWRGSSGPACPHRPRSAKARAIMDSEALRKAFAYPTPVARPNATTITTSACALEPTPMKRQGQEHGLEPKLANERAVCWRDPRMYIDDTGDVSRGRELAAWRYECLFGGGMKEE
eukprot:gene32684-17699_t